MPAAFATSFTPNSELSRKTGIIVRWPSSDDLVHDDRGYSTQAERTLVWGINPNLIPVLSDLGIGPTEISFVRKEHENPKELRRTDKNEIYVPHSIFKPDHSGAVRTVIVGSLNGTLEPPHIEIEVKTRAICAMANVLAQKIEPEKREDRFALAALAITNGLIAQQLLRSTRIIQANNGMKNPTQVIRETLNHEPHVVAETLLGKISAASLVVLEESLHATTRLASYDNGVAPNAIKFLNARTDIRQRPIFVPARLA